MSQGAIEDGELLARASYDSEMYGVQQPSLYPSTGQQPSLYPAASSPAAKQICTSIGEPLTGEVSGAVLHLDLLVVEKLSMLALPSSRMAGATGSTKEYETGPDRLSQSEWRERNETRDFASDELKEGLPFPVLLHLQNIQMSLAAPFSWPKDTSEAAQTRQDPESEPGAGATAPVHRGDGGLALDQTSHLGKITLVLVRGRVESEARSSRAVTVDLDADTGDDICVAQPVLMLAYEEWETVNTPARQGAPYPARPSIRGRSAPDSLTKIVDHKVFAIQRILMQGTPLRGTEAYEDDEVKAAGGGDSHQGALGRSELPYHYHSSDDEDATPGFGRAWQRAHGFRRRAPSHARGHRREATAVRVVMNGVRLDWHAPLQVCDRAPNHPQKSSESPTKEP